jgi:hypothetical protein
MADVAKHTEDWQKLPWKEFQRNIYRLQKRIYQAERRNQILIKSITAASVYDKDPFSEELIDGKLSRSVREWR